MDDSIVYFHQNITEITGCMPVGITKTAYNSIQKSLAKEGQTGLDVLKELSGQLKYVLMAKTPSREMNGKFIYLAYKMEGVYVLAEDEQEPLRFTMVGFMRNTLALQNEAMRYGSMIYFKNGWRIQIRFTDSNIFTDLVVGQEFSPGQNINSILRNSECQDPEDELDDLMDKMSEMEARGFEDESPEAAFNIPEEPSEAEFTEEMKFRMKAACLNTAQQTFCLPHRVQETPEDEILRQGKQLQMPRGMEKMLNTAAQYAELTSQLEQEKAAAAGSVFYTDIRPVLYEDRVDRVCYEFVLLENPEKKFDETLFRIGGSIIFTDRDGAEQQAEITEFVREDPDDEESAVTAVRALFKEQISIASFDKEGSFAPSISNVSRMVQEAAIDRLFSYSSSSAFTFDYLYSNNTEHLASQHPVAGLDEVVQKLKCKKYPPNASQMHAITEAIKTDNMYLVMGPPGTGKTTVILEWVKYFILQEHKRVLISSKNNKAVDNVLARLAEEKDISTIRIGSEAKLQEDVKPYMFENRISTLRQEICGKVLQERELFQKILDQYIKHRKAFDTYLQNQRMIDQMRKVKSQIQEGTEKLQAARANLKDCERGLEELRKSREDIGEYIKTEQAKRDRHHGLAALFLSKRDKENAEAEEQLLQEASEKFTAMEKICNNYRTQVSGLQSSIDKKEEELRAKYSISYEEAVRRYPRKDPGYIKSNIVYTDRTNSWIWHPAENELWGITDPERMTKPLDNWAVSVKNCIAISRKWEETMQTQQNYALEELLLDSVDLVGATCIGIQSKKKFRNIDFDVTIIDEAGQIQVHDALVPISLSPKFIMLGDHKQIPPMADQDLVAACEENGVDTTLLKKSLFEELYNRAPDGCKIMLDTQYRMPGDIADTISEWFYDGKYVSPPFKRQIDPKSLMLPSLSGRTYLLIDTSGAPGRHERPIPNGGCDNSLEAEIAKTLIRLRLMEIDKEPDEEKREKARHEIGVISAYKAQVKLIRKKLAELLPDNLVREMVASLDSFQGQERDLIIYSFTKSSDKPASQRRIGFLNELRRLNVAMSRCKKGLVLIGDMQFLMGCRHMDLDEDGKPVYEQSEKQFGDFIRKMYDDVVKRNRGQRLIYQEFMERSMALLPPEPEKKAQQTEADRKKGTEQEQQKGEAEPVTNTEVQPESAKQGRAQTKQQNTAMPENRTENTELWEKEAVPEKEKGKAPGNTSEKKEKEETGEHPAEKNLKEKAGKTKEQKIPEAGNIHLVSMKKLHPQKTEEKAEESVPEKSIQEEPVPGSEKGREWRKPKGYNILLEEDLIKTAKKEKDSLEIICGLTAQEAKAAADELFGTGCFIAVHAPQDEEDSWGVVHLQSDRGFASKSVILAMSHFCGVQKFLHYKQILKNRHYDENAMKQFLASIHNGTEGYVYLADLTDPRHSLLITDAEVTEIYADGWRQKDTVNAVQDWDGYISTVQKRIRQFAKYTMILTAKQAKKYGLSQEQYQVTGALKEQTEQHGQYTIDKEGYEKVYGSPDQQADDDTAKEPSLSEEETGEWKQSFLTACRAQEEYIRFLLNHADKEIKESGSVTDLMQYLDRAQGTMIPQFRKFLLDKYAEDGQNFQQIASGIKQSENMVQAVQGIWDVPVPVKQLVLEIGMETVKRNARIRQEKYQKKGGERQGS